jgi:hypothetical protein
MTTDTDCDLCSEPVDVGHHAISNEEGVRLGNDQHSLESATEDGAHPCAICGERAIVCCVVEDGETDPIVAWRCAAGHRAFAHRGRRRFRDYQGGGWLLA